MNSIANGVDLIEIERFQNLDPKIKNRFFQRVFTRQELSEAGQSLQHLAGKFAAKEAASKALGCGIGSVRWQDLEILNDKEGKPILTLHEKASMAASKAGWNCWSVSISHTNTLAIATVTALIETPERSES
jgi:holo-[acyl-carrier protein] synthase